jgi:hypothetical protein
LKARYCECEGLDLKFPKIKKLRGGNRESKHVAIPADKLKLIFELAAESLKMNTLVHLLYDAAARI